MNKPHSTFGRVPAKRKIKPHRPANFPLFPHDSGQWAKKVRGKLHYFGSWSDRQAALDRWLAEKDYLLAGKVPRVGSGDDLTVKRLCNLFLDSRQRKVDTGELSQRTFDDYFAIAEVVATELGKATAVELLVPEDFAALRSKLAEKCNLKTLEGRIACVRAIFNYADKNGLLERPLSRIWGTEFAKPSKSALSKLKAQTQRLFTAEQIWQLLDQATPTLKAMILLGINGGFGNTDIARMKLGQIDLVSGWIEQARNKTGRLRRVPLWPETIAAIKGYLEERPEPKQKADADLVFITKYGGNWIPDSKDNPPSKEFTKLRRSVGIKDRGKSFYTLRHTFQTIGDETCDFVAVSAIMGHAAGSISDGYRAKISDERLLAVVNQVRSWLLKGKPKATVARTQTN